MILSERRRVLKHMSAPTGSQSSQTPPFMAFSAIMLFVLTAIVAGVLFNRLRIEAADESAPTRRIQDLVTLLKEAENKRESLETELTNVRAKMSLRPDRKPQANDPELKRLYRLAGLTEISGPGVVVTLEDSKTAPKDGAGKDPNSGHLQADDLLKLVNELKAAGATAIAINDQRLVVSSEIVASGSSISVNQSRLSQPVIIKALGKPDLLMAGLKIRGGITEYLQFFGINTKVAVEKQLILPPYKGFLGT